MYIFFELELKDACEHLFNLSQISVISPKGLLTKNQKKPSFFNNHKLYTLFNYIKKSISLPAKFEHTVSGALSLLEKITSCGTATRYINGKSRKNPWLYANIDTRSNLNPTTAVIRSCFWSLFSFISFVSEVTSEKYHLNRAQSPLCLEITKQFLQHYNEKNYWNHLSSNEELQIILKIRTNNWHLVADCIQVELILKKLCSFAQNVFPFDKNHELTNCKNLLAADDEKLEKMGEDKILKNTPILQTTKRLLEVSKIITDKVMWGADGDYMQKMIHKIYHKIKNHAA